MANSTEKIEALIERLETSGADGRRLDALRCTQRFKRSWVELAKTLVGLRRDKAHQAWGYPDFHDYCAKELHLRRATVDKLTISYSTLNRLAPQVLTWDGVEREVPSMQAVQYFGKAVEAANASNANAKPSTPALNHPREVIKALRHAVFDEGKSATELRRRFDPILHPRPQGSEQLDRIGRALAASRRLCDLIPDVEGLPAQRVATIERTLGALRQDLERLAEPLRERVAATKAKRAPKRG